MSPLLTPEFRRADESKQREAGTDGQTTVNQERELRDVAERRGWREDRAQLRDGVHDAVLGQGALVVAAGVLGGFNRSSQQSLCEPIVERHRAPRRVFASREFFAAWR